MTQILKLAGFLAIIAGVLIGLASPEAGATAGLLMLAGLGSFVAGRLGQ